MTETKSPRYARTAGLTLVATLLVVASCEVDQLPTSVLEPEASEAESTAPAFSATYGRPELKNRAEVVRALRNEYPQELRRAGVAGKAVIWFYVSDTGRVRDRRVSVSSGHQQLDEAALRIGDVFRFTPARTREGPVAVWIEVPITFSGI